MSKNVIMVIDDSAVDRKLMKRIIEKSFDHVQVLESEDGAELYEGTILLNIKVIILDLVLENENGLALLSFLKKNRLTANIPVIIFSSLSDPETIKKALELGAYDYFEKPLSNNDLSFALSLKIDHALEQKLNTDRLMYLRNHDTMTGLFTRRYLEEFHAERFIKDEPIALIILDINGLKVINDVYGYQVGDEIINALSLKLKKSCNNCLCASRWGSDEFSLLVSLKNKVDVENYIHHMIGVLHDAHENEFEISFGYHLDSTGMMTMNDLIRNAEDHLSSNKVIASSSFKNNMIKTINNTLQQKNPREELHSTRVSETAGKIAEAMDFSPYEIQKIKVVGQMHDIGKIGIDESILNKEGKLTDEEWLAIRKHPEIGFRILNTSIDTLEISRAVLGHHERWDGKGYPQRLKGEEIPLMARIISVADIFDAMTGYRTYKNAMTLTEALEEVEACSGTQFDPLVVDVFSKIMKKHDTLKIS